MLSLASHPWTARLAITAYNLWFYVLKTVIPLGLSPLYELPVHLNPIEPRFAIACALIAMMADLRRENRM